MNICIGKSIISSYIYLYFIYSNIVLSVIIGTEILAIYIMQTNINFVSCPQGIS